MTIVDICFTIHYDKQNNNTDNNFSTEFNAFINSYMHTPDAKTIKQNLIFLFLTTYDSSIVNKPKPVDMDERRARTITSRDTKLIIL